MRKGRKTFVAHAAHAGRVRMDEDGSDGMPVREHHTLDYWLDCPEVSRRKISPGYFD